MPTLASGMNGTRNFDEGLPLRNSTCAQKSRRTGQQQFLAPPGVFDMDGFHRAVHIYMGNKTVGTVNKNAVCAPSEAHPALDSGHSQAV